MFAIAAALPFAVISLVVGAAILLTRRAWTRHPFLAPAYGLAVVGLIAQLIWIAYWILPIVGAILSVGVVITSIVFLVYSRFWQEWRIWLPLTLAAAGVLLFTIGFSFLWGGATDPFTTLAARFRGMPPDNVIQYLFADRLWKGESTTALIGDWNGSDRPPLQSGLLLLVRPFEVPFGAGSGAEVYSELNLRFGAFASITSQLLWVPGVFALVRALRFSPRIALLAVAFVSVIPVAITNTSFTWPKMMSAGLAIAGIAILTNSILEKQHLPAIPLTVAAVLAILAILSHGGAALALPIFVVLAIIIVRNAGVQQSARAGVIAVAAVLFTYLPWIIYGKFADPSYDRLLKWHFAGYIPPDESSFTDRLMQAYSSTPLADLIAARVSNLQRVFDVSFAARLTSEGVSNSREQDFYSTFPSIGLAAVLLVGFTAAYIALRISRRSLSARARISAVLLLSALLSVVIWSLVMFSPDSAIVHQGSYIWLLLFASIPFAWLAGKRPLIAIAVAAIQAAYALAIYAAPAKDLPAVFSPTATIVAIAGALLVCGALTLTIARKTRHEVALRTRRASRTRSA